MLKFRLRESITPAPRGYVGLVATADGALATVDENGSVKPVAGNGSVNVRVRWSDILDKPTAFPIASHTHGATEIVGMGAGGPVDWADITGKPDTFPPAWHMQTIDEVDGLQAALDAKVAASGVSSAITAHTNDTDPHTQYMMKADRGATNGVAPLVSGLVPLVNLPSLGGDPWTWLKLALNNTVSTTAFANVTGLSFTGTALATYVVDLFGAYQTAATITGIGFALDVPAGATVIGMNHVNTSATAVGGTEQIADATTTGATTGVRAANTNTPIMARWIVAMGATGGTVQLMQRSEVAGSATVLQASLTALAWRSI